MKPRVKLEGQDGNIFAVLGSATKSLKKAGLPHQAKEMQQRVFNSGSYDEALAIISEYIDWEL
jgi:hypothetical protein